MPYLRRIKGDELDHSELDDNFGLQFSHSNSFSVGDLVYPDSLTTWAEAQADAEDTLATGVIVNVDGNDFSVSMADGTWYSLEAHGYAVTQKLYLSAATPGARATAPPSTGFVQPVGSVIDADTLVFRLGYIATPAEEA